MSCGICVGSIIHWAVCDSTILVQFLRLSTARICSSDLYGDKCVAKCLKSIFKVITFINFSTYLGLWRNVAGVLIEHKRPCLIFIRMKT